MEPTLTGGELRKGGEKKVTSRWLEKKKTSIIFLGKNSGSSSRQGGVGGWDWGATGGWYWSCATMGG